METPEFNPRIKRNSSLNRFQNRNLFHNQVVRATAFLHKAGLPNLAEENAYAIAEQTESTLRKHNSLVYFLHQLPSLPEPATNRIDYFFSDELLDGFLGVIDEAPEQEIRDVLELLLIQYQATQEEIAVSWKALLLDAGSLTRDEQAAGQRRERPGLAWVLNLIPSFPVEAIKGIDAYLLANRPVLPTAYTNALSNCEAIIRTKYLNHWQPRQLFTELGDRDFELLVAFLYEKQGYRTHFTAYPENKYADIQVTESTTSSQITYLVQCKIRSTSVGVTEARQLLAGVQATNSAKGILITTSRFSPEALRFASITRNIDLVDNERLVVMLRDFLGIYWHSKVDTYISEQKSRYAQVK